MVQSCLPCGANVLPICRKPKKWLPWQRLLVTTWPATQPPLHNQSPSCYHSHKTSYSNLRLKIGCHGNVPHHLWTLSNTSFLGPIRALCPNGISIGSAVFAYMTTKCPCTLQWDDSYLPSKLPFPMGIWTPPNTWFPGPNRVLYPNCISISSAIFAGLTSVTDRPTDRPRYSVTVGHT